MLLCFEYKVVNVKCSLAEASSDAFMFRKYKVVNVSLFKRNAEFYGFVPVMGKGGKRLVF